MVRSAHSRAGKKAAKPYHHVDLRRALLDEALRTIQQSLLIGKMPIRRDDPVLMARFLWALVHGTAMLVIDGQLPEAAQREALEQYSPERSYASIRQEALRSE
jgi:hypothetical protein